MSALEAVAEESMKEPTEYTKEPNDLELSKISDDDFSRIFNFNIEYKGKK